MVAAILQCATPVTAATLQCATPVTAATLQCPTPVTAAILQCATPANATTLQCATPVTATTQLCTLYSPSDSRNPAVCRPSDSRNPAMLTNNTSVFISATCSPALQHVYCWGHDVFWRAHAVACFGDFNIQSLICLPFLRLFFYGDNILIIVTHPIFFLYLHRKTPIFI